MIRHILFSAALMLGHVCALPVTAQEGGTIGSSSSRNSNSGTTDQSISYYKENLRKILEQLARPNRYGAKSPYEISQDMIPTEREIRAVYRDPIAKNMIKAFAQMDRGNFIIQGKERQTEVLLTVAWTDDLIDGGSAMRKFPGGYSKATKYMKRGFPIATFKFVEPGKDLGMAFNGLVHTGSRWVMLPKPWRFLND